MIKKSNAKKEESLDYLRFKEAMSSMVYAAVPCGKDVLCIGPEATDTDYGFSFRVHEAVCRIMVDVLTEGKAPWLLCVNPENDSQVPFLFRPKRHAVKGFAAVPMVIRSCDIGVPRRSVRSLAKRLRHSEPLYNDASFIRFDDDREMIANHWGYALAWRLSDPSTFTDPCILLNQCDRKILAIKLCKVIQDAMNEALSRSGLADYRIEIPTYDREEFESSRQLYLEGKLDGKAFSDLVFSRI